MLVTQLALAQQTKYEKALPQIERHNFKKMPKGWERTQVAEGDLNKDGLKDKAFFAVAPAVEHTYKSELGNSWYTTTSRNIVIAVYLRQADKTYRRIVANTKLIEPFEIVSQEVVHFEDTPGVPTSTGCIADINIKNGCLTLEAMDCAIGWYGVYKIRYRWQQGALSMINYWCRNVMQYKATDVDWNLTTGQWVRYNDSEDKVEETGFKKLRPLPTLQQTKSFELEQKEIRLALHE